MPKKCLDKFQILADQVVFVGDSENDILPAKQLRYVFCSCDIRIWKTTRKN